MPYFFYEACPVAEVPEGGRRRVQVEGYDLAIWNVGGTLYASGDPCPHERVSLAEGGSLDGEVVTCGAHRWEFNVRTGECYEDPKFCLKHFPVGRKDGTIFVGFWADDEGADEEGADEEGADEEG